MGKTPQVSGKFPEALIELHVQPTPLQPSPTPRNMGYDVPVSDGGRRRRDAAAQQRRKSRKNRGLLREAANSRKRRNLLPLPPFPKFIRYNLYRGTPLILPPPPPPSPPPNNGKSWEVELPN